MISDDEDLQLSASTQAILNSFLTERTSQEQRFADLQHKIDEYEKAGRVVKMSDFEEDWRQSQFWYSEETAETLAMELLEGVGEGERVACVSAPSVYVKIRELRSTGKLPKGLEVHLLEYDPRFAVFREEFVPYDFERPLDLPGWMNGQFDRCIVDPPHLSEDCQTRTAMSVKWMMKPWAKEGEGRPRVVLCTGERMRGLVERLYAGCGLRCTGYDIKHTNGLGNEFRCYASFESEKFVFLGDDE